MANKVLIVDPNVPGLTELKDACQDDVLFVTYVAPLDSSSEDESEPTPTDLKELCKDATNVGLVWANPDMQSIPFSGFEEMLHDNLVVDLITCDLGKDDFPERMQALETQHTNLKIRYSLDKTANPEQGGDWIMESHNVSVKPVFFTDKLALYKYSLEIIVCHLKYVASTAEFAITSTTTLITETKECSKVTFTGDINWPYNHILTMDQHAGNSALIIEGVTGNKITICESETDSTAYSGYDSYIGMIRNGYYNGSTNITGQGGTLKGLNVVCSYIGQYGGGIIQQGANYQQSTHALTIETCSFTGSPLRHFSGGICGYLAGYTNGLCNITGCSLLGGTIFASYGGGICGYGAGEAGECNITNCTTTGNVQGTYAGGICGRFAGRDAGLCKITNCSLTGDIIGNYAGGICGDWAGANNGSCVVTQCSILGNVGVSQGNSSHGGGICGQRAGWQGSCEIYDCSVTGTVQVNEGGGICGSRAGIDGLCKIYRCSVTGDITWQTSTGGGICGSQAGDNGICVVTQCSVVGNLSTAYAGGICGAQVGQNNGICVITQCSFVGNVIEQRAGGIAGQRAGYNSGLCVVTQCSVVGNISGSNAGGIVGAKVAEGGGSCNITNCYLDGPTNVTGNTFNLGTATIDKCWFSASSATDATLTDVNLSDGLVKLNVERSTLSSIITGAASTSYNQNTIAPPGTAGDAGTHFLSLGDAFTSYDHDTEASTDNVAWPSALISAPDPPANSQPVANALSQNVIEDTPTTITLSGTDEDGNNLTFAIVDNPTNGSVNLVGTAATYTPSLNYNGVDSFTYKANDGNLDSDPATVSITVSVVNDSPEVTAVSVSLFENTSKEITLVGSDVEDNTLTYTIVASPAQGTLGNVTVNKVTYTPNANSSGADSFTYKANDGTSDSNVASCSITVTPLPVVEDLFKTLDANGNIAITLSGTNNTTSYSVTQPSNGSVTLDDNTVTYDPSLNYSGTDRFTYKANNGADSRNAIIDLMIHAANVPADEKSEITKAYDTVIAISEFNEDNNDVVTWTEPTDAAKKIVWTNLTNVTRKKDTRKTRAKKILQAIQAKLGSTKKSFHATPAVFGIQAQASKLVVVEPQTLGKTDNMSTLEANNSVTKQTIADDTVVYSPFTADEFALFKDTSDGLYRMTFTENGSNKTYNVDYRSSDGITTETYTKVNPDDNWYPFKNLFFIFGSGSGSGEGSGGAAADPFIQPIFGKLYEIPNTINHYRMVEGDDLIVNASYRYFTPKEKTAIRNYYYRVTGDMIGINSLVVDGGVAQNKAFIQCEGITLTYDYDTKHVCASQNVEYSIEDRVDGKGVVFTLPHSKYGKISVDCRHYINPQAYSGMFVTIQRKARECIGLLIRNYNSIPFIVNSETDTTSKKSIAKSAEHYEAPKSLLKNVTRS